LPKAVTPLAVALIDSPVRVGGLETHGSVASAHDVAPKCCLSHRHVLRAAGIGKECFMTDGRIAVTGVVSKHSRANGHVLVGRIVCGQGKSTYRSIWL